MNPRIVVINKDSRIEFTPLSDGRIFTLEVTENGRSATIVFARDHLLSDQEFIIALASAWYTKWVGNPLWVLSRAHDWIEWFRKLDRQLVSYGWKAIRREG